MHTRYQPLADGFRIVGGTEPFNRALYGGHDHDDDPQRFVTFGGDLPVVMGAVTDWRVTESCSLAKCGTFMAGTATTPGLWVPIYYYTGGTDGDRTSAWFHETEGAVTTFRNGWMEHRVEPFSFCYACPRVEMDVYPLLPEAGFLVRLSVTTDMQVHLVLAFGGLTDLLGQLGHRVVKSRLFSPTDCRGNMVETGIRRATVTHPALKHFRSQVRVGTTLPVTVSVGNASLVANGPGRFLTRDDSASECPMVRMECVVGPGQHVEGYFVAVHNADEAALERWLAHPAPVDALRQAIRAKHAAIEIQTPDVLLDATVPAVVLAQDACWHGNTFYHGAHSYHHPFLGWRTWYGPTVIGWHDRVATAVRTHAASQVREAAGQEAVVYTGPGPYSSLSHSHGFVPEYPLDRSTEALKPRQTIFYNMQEVFVDQTLHHLEWTRDLALARAAFPVLRDVLAWETRILDPDGDGLYQNWLNTWVSDAHAYNGGGCAQASAYNFRAHTVMARLARLLGEDPAPFTARAAAIREACLRTLWLEDRGVMAEYVDTIGEKLVHPSPELATIYHTIEAGLLDPFQAYRQLRFTHYALENAAPLTRGGRLVRSSNWYPNNYSSCGLYPAENLHLAWAYYNGGLAEEGWRLLSTIAGAHALGIVPGAVAHVINGQGFSTGCPDFPDITSLYLRVLVEGLFGVRFNLLEDAVSITPQCPPEWTRAQLKITDLELDYRVRGRTRALTVTSAVTARCTLRLPLPSTTVEAVHLQGEPAPYRLEPGIGRCWLVVEANLPGTLCLETTFSGERPPVLAGRERVTPGHDWRARVRRGTIAEWRDPAASLTDARITDDTLSARASGNGGHHTVFLRVTQGAWNGWLPADFEIRPPAPRPARAPRGTFVPVDMGRLFNIALADIHSQAYRQPRPRGYSIMAKLNGRFGWDWNAGGWGTVKVDDRRLREADGGVFTTPSGIPFLTPTQGPNAACASVWENFPRELVVPLSSSGTELAVWLIGVTNPMQAYVENARLTVHYADGQTTSVALVNPVNFDDWLVAPVQADNETVPFSDANHAIVQRLALDPRRELRELRVRAVANEVIVGVLGVSVRRSTGKGA